MDTSEDEGADSGGAETHQEGIDTETERPQNTRKLVMLEAEKDFCLPVKLECTLSPRQHTDVGSCFLRAPTSHKSAYVPA